MSLDGRNLEWTLGSRLLGVKLDINPAILPRDKSLGTKIFMLVPRETKTVRDFKTYVANFVLRTPAPFQVFTEEYRIRDDEDVRIFSLINGPCRLMPVPLPPSALSSTPKPKSSDKRVTFFGHLQTSPVEGPTLYGGDDLDGQMYRNIHSPQLMITGTDPSSSALVGNIAEFRLEGNDISMERGKRRKRRRSRKSKLDKTNGEDSNSNLSDNETDKATPSCSTSKNASFVTPGSKRRLPETMEETESEEETNESSTAEFEFAPPTKIPRQREEKGGGSRKPKNLGDSAFESFGNSAASSSTSSELSVSFKPRQDTPIVSRVIKNLSVFNSARKIIDDFSVGDDADDMGSNKGRYESEFEMTDAEFYDKLIDITSVDEFTVGDLIAFKVLQLDERYNPSVSEYKEGFINAIDGKMLAITYTKNEEIVRNGKYELHDEAESSDHAGSKPECVSLNFGELIEPKILVKARKTKCTDIPGKVCEHLVPCDRIDLFSKDAEEIKL